MLIKSFMTTLGLWLFDLCLILIISDWHHLLPFGGGGEIGLQRWQLMHTKSGMGW